MKEETRDLVYKIVIGIVSAVVGGVGGFAGGKYRIKSQVNSQISQVVNVGETDYVGAVDYIINQNTEYKAEIESLKSENEKLEDKNKELSAEIDKYKKESTSTSASEKNTSSTNGSNVNTAGKKKLFELQPLIGKLYDFAQETIGEKKDNIGNLYPNGYILYANEYTAKSITYALEEKYKTLSGEIALDSENNSLRDGIWFEFYTNGEMIGSTDHLYAGVRPISFEIDVSGVNDLEIQAKITGTTIGSVLTNGFYVE